MPKVRKAPELKRAHRQTLTPLVLRKARTFEGFRKVYFREWVECKQVEFLPDGTPYKVSSYDYSRILSGMIVEGLNKPLIFVSDLLGKAERQEVARHELNEWQRFRSKREHRQEGHKHASRRENRRLSKSVSETTSWYCGMIAKLGPEKAENLTRADYLRWLKQQNK